MKTVELVRPSESLTSILKLCVPGGHLGRVDIDTVGLGELLKTIGEIDQGVLQIHNTHAIGIDISSATGGELDLKMKRR